jgi:hypothetical protein
VRVLGVWDGIVRVSTLEKGLVILEGRGAVERVVPRGVVTLLLLLLLLFLEGV